MTSSASAAAITRGFITNPTTPEGLGLSGVTRGGLIVLPPGSLLRPQNDYIPDIPKKGSISIHGDISAHNGLRLCQCSGCSLGLDAERQRSVRSARSSWQNEGRHDPVAKCRTRCGRCGRPSRTVFVQIVLLATLWVDV